MTELVKKALAQDKEAFVELMDRNALSMYKVARGILANDADIADAIQNTILICFEKLDTLKKPEYFKTWMIRILINECNKQIRYYGRCESREEFSYMEYQDSSLEEIEFKEILSQIDEKYRLVTILYYIEGYKVMEIAKLLQMNPNTVKTYLHRARKKLAELYESKGAHAV